MTITELIKKYKFPFEEVQLELTHLKIENKFQNYKKEFGDETFTKFRFINPTLKNRKGLYIYTTDKKNEIIDQRERELILNINPEWNTQLREAK